MKTTTICRFVGLEVGVADASPFHELVERRKSDPTISEACRKHGDSGASLCCFTCLAGKKLDARGLNQSYVSPQDPTTKNDDGRQKPALTSSI